ncbi:MAG: hypothetical protein V1877_00905 [Candidatus Tagabacteria bacterium]
MNKKILIALGIIVGLIIIGLVIFWFVYLGKPIPPAAESIFPGGLFPSAEKKTIGQIAPGSVVNPPPTIQAGQQKPLTQLTEKAVAGATFIEKIKEDKTKIGVARYLEKATGHIYDIDLPAGEAGPQGGISEIISNTTIPNIFEAYWSPDGKQVLTRYTENNETGIEDPVRNFSLISIATTSSAGIFLLSTIRAVASSPKENKIFYLMPWEESYLGITASFEDKKQKQVLTTSFGEWAVTWPSERVITLLSKPSATINGYLYKLDPITGSFEKILADIPGLTGLMSPGGESVFYSQGGYSGIETGLYDVAKKTSIPFFGLITLPEKCVWSKLNKGIIYCAVPSILPSGRYPDDWYMGLISFADRIWKIDTIKGTTEIISTESGSEFDFINLFLSKNENYLFFQNKKDGTLWSLQL